MQQARKLANGFRYRYQPRKGPFDTDIGSKLPESYRKFFAEWKSTDRKPVHYVNKEGRFKLNEHGRVVPVINMPILDKETKEQHLGIWGGEAVVEGYRLPAHRYETVVPEYWVPRLLDQIVYSEILDKYLNVAVTQRTVDLINEHYGFDKYLLSTPACDLNSLLACKIKKKLLVALYDKTLYPDDPTKQETIYNKYKQYLENYSRDDLEWYGLSLPEAQEKCVALEREAMERSKVPLKVTFRKELLEELKQFKLDGKLDAPDEKKESFIKKFNPFAKVD
uniref:39S ribosomal protein L28, mitochondrial n=1 Tax=Cacopsylla melanoneura TaxID=428564 RepID=A0A8D9A4Z5_9HEMI